MAKDKRDGGRVESISFRVGPDVREVDDASVEALDAALARIGSGELLHMLDPRRINAFSSGGPSTWSVAFVPVGDDFYYVTYGNSDRIDPARSGVGFELSIRVPAESSGLWAGMLLRQMVRYMLVSRRELKVGEYMPFGMPITRVTGGADDDDNFPPTEMDSVLVVADPLMPTVKTPRGSIEVRRVVGVLPDERDLMEPWSVAGLASQLRDKGPELTTDIQRASHAHDARFVSAMEQGSSAEGSQFGFVAVPGVSWEVGDDERCTISLPGGREARRIHRMVQARLPHGRHLLVHDSDPEQQRAVALTPSKEWRLAVDGEVLVVQLPADAPMLQALATAPEGRVVWKL